MWRLRLSHYKPRGELKLTRQENGYTAEFRLSFHTDGANMIAILGDDASWGYQSNGQMERDYLSANEATTTQSENEGRPITRTTVGVIEVLSLNVGGRDVEESAGEHFTREMSPAI